MHAAVQAMTLCVWLEQSVYPARVHAKVLSTHLMPLRGNAVSIRLHTKYTQYRHPLNTGSLMSTTTNPAKRVFCYYMPPRIIVYELEYSNIYIYMLQAIREVRQFMKCLKMSGISWSGEKL